MINPNKITNYNLSEAELQRQLVFWVLVAGKKAKTIAQRMKCVFNQLGDNNTKPFDLIKTISKNNKGYDWLAEILKNNGIGCQNNKARSLIELAHSDLNLKNCTLDELESIHGIGRKTSRCFILHTRENAQCSGLDTHILHCLRDIGYNVPKSTVQKNLLKSRCCG
jgi:endonuclease III